MKRWNIFWQSSHNQQVPGFGPAHKGKGNQMLYYLMQCLIIAGVALGVYAVVDAIKNYKGK